MPGRDAREIAQPCGSWTGSDKRAGDYERDMRAAYCFAIFGAGMMPQQNIVGSTHTPPETMRKTMAIMV